MNTIEINRHLKDISCYYGTVCRDKLPTVKKLPFAVVVNSDPCSKPGQHWLAIYIDKNGLGNYFDSYGQLPYHEEIIQFLNKNCRKGYKTNNKILQSLFSDTCGYYCIFFIRQISKGKEKINKYFVKDCFINDMLVKKFVKYYKKI